MNAETENQKFGKVKRGHVRFDPKDGDVGPIQFMAPKKYRRLLQDHADENYDGVISECVRDLIYEGITGHTFSGSVSNDLK